MDDKIVLAACKLHHEDYGVLVLSGYRHWSMDMHATFDKLKLCGWKVIHGEGAQGFVGASGRYYTREEALDLVKKTGQSYDPKRGNHEDSIDKCKEAFSEGFW